MQKDAWSKFSLDSLVTNRDKKFCDADTLTEEMKELLIEKILVYSNNVLEIYWKADFIKYFSDTSRIIGRRQERMSETAIKAPKVNHWIFVLKDGKFVFDKKTLEAIDKVYAILEAVEPCGEDNRRELWLKAERGTIDDYDDYESLKDEEVVENYEEFEKMWHEEYPDEISWYHLVTIERDDYRAIFLGRELIYQSRILEAHSSYEYNVEELFVWMQDAVKKCIA